MKQVPEIALYLEKAFINRNACINNAIKQIKNSKQNYSGIVVCGISGTVFGSVLSYKLKLPLTVVRKKGEIRRSSNLIESADLTSLSNYLIVDDLMDTGRTIRHIISTIRQVHKNYSGTQPKWEANNPNYFPMPKCAGIYLYIKDIFINAVE